MMVILLGPPGAGKGTQAQHIAERFKIARLSTGEMLRAGIAAGTDVGARAEAIMERGELVPDDIVVSIMADRIDRPDCANGAILDGFPRTLAQAKALDEMLVEKDLALDHVIEMKVDEGALVERISGRFACADCGAGYHDRFKPAKVEGVCDDCGSSVFSRRPDDNEEIVKSRLAAYKAQTVPLLPFYRRKGVISEVDGMAGIAEVSRQIDQVLDAA